MSSTAINFSVIVTVLNEQDSIIRLLNSLAQQSHTPKEIVIVDAGSTDQTTQFIDEWCQKHPQLNLKLLVKEGVNRSKGRNIAVSKARYQYIAAIDAGCHAKSDWLEELSNSFVTNPRAQVIAGFYLADYQTNLQHAFSLYLCTQPESMIDTDYLPSSRSIAFTKEAWEKVDGYPEHLETCEDLIFAKNLKECTNMIVNNKAIVYWQQSRSWTQFIHQVSNYAKGDIHAAYSPHTIKIVSVYWRYVLFIWLPWFFFPYLLYPLYKFRNHLKSPDHWLFIPVIQVISDLSVMKGGIQGIISRSKRLE